MSLVYRFTTLDDASSFLLEAKSLPVVATTTRAVQRSVRACILLSWVALEESFDHAVELWNSKGQTFGPLPGPLRSRLSAVLAAASRPPIDEVAFATLRKIRNELTHPRTAVDEPELTVDQAEETFQFCMFAIRAFFPFPVDYQF